MFSFLPLINNSVFNGLRVSLINISAIISLKTINMLHFSFGLHYSIFFEMSFIPFEYSIKGLESLKCFKPVLSHLLIKNYNFGSHESLANK